MAGGPSEVDRLEERRKKLASVREKLVEVRRFIPDAVERSGFRTAEGRDIALAKLVESIEELTNIVASLE